MPWHYGEDAGRLRMDETFNCVVHEGCWCDHLRRTAGEPLNRGILEVGRLWSHFAQHQKKKVSDPRNTDSYRPPLDLRSDPYFADIQEAYLPADQSTDGHLFTKKNNAEVQKLFWSLGLRELLLEHKYAERPIRRMTGAELLLKPGDTEELDPHESVPPECRAADFLKVIHLFDPELEVSLHTKLECGRLDLQG